MYVCVCVFAHMHISNAKHSVCCNISRAISLEHAISTVTYRVVFCLQCHMVIGVDVFHIVVAYPINKNMPVCAYSYSHVHTCLHIHTRSSHLPSPLNYSTDRKLDPPPSSLSNPHTHTIPPPTPPPPPPPHSSQRCGVAMPTRYP